MNDDLIRDPLLEELSDLAQDVPPMPEDVHAGWMKLVEEDAMMPKDNSTEKKTFRIPRSVTRFLSAAAALVFLVGGTLASRDVLSPKGDSPRTETAAYKAAGDYGSSMARSTGNANALYSTASMESAMMADMDYEVAEEPAAGETAQSNAQKIIRTASMTLSTTEFDAAAASLRELCAANGGWVSYSSQSTGYNGLRSAWFTLRVPAEHFDAFLAGADGVGRVSSRAESADDVTESYYDTATRLATKQALMARLTAMTTETADLADLLELESKIADVQYDIDRLQGNLNHTDNQVNYATVDVTLKEEAPADTMVVREKTLGERLVSALTVGWEAFAEFFADMAVFLVAALPFLAVLAVLVIVIRIVRKKHRK